MYVYIYVCIYIYVYTYIYIHMLLLLFKSLAAFVELETANDPAAQEILSSPGYLDDQLN